MFYKFQNGQWWTGRVITLSPTCTLDENNKENECGWEWHDAPPSEYVEWLNNQNQQ